MTQPLTKPPDARAVPENFGVLAVLAFVNRVSKGRFPARRVAGRFCQRVLGFVSALQEANELITTYVGWLREGRGRWQPVARGATWGAAWDELLRVGSLAPRCERVVLPEGKTP